MVDTNAVVALLLHTQATEIARRWRREQPVWAAPRLLLAEVCNVLMGEVRRGHLALADAIEMGEAVDGLIQWVPDAPPAEVLAAAHSGGLTAYDAGFVAVAVRQEALLLTADKAILRAFPTVAVALR